jgi:hypothetical protein
VLAEADKFDFNPGREERGMVEDRVRQKDFNLHTWVGTIPMTDDIYLGLQAQNIARVEMSVVRRWESEALDEQEADPRSYQGPKYRELMALSQMWVFGLYEFVRTWRQRARLLIQFEEKYNKLAIQAARDAYLKDIVDKAKNKARLATRFPVYYPEHVAKIADPKFMKSVRAYWDKTEEMYGELSAVRMPAAKHELPKKHGQEALIADAPGMGLPDPLTGSICWQVLLGDKQTTIMRRNLADNFFGIFGWHEDIETALLLTNEAKARRKRLRREARRYAKAPRQVEHLDRFFRTEREATRDDQSIALIMRTQDQDNRHGDRRCQQREKHREKAEVFKSEPPPQDKSLPGQEAPPEPLPYFVKEVGGGAVKYEPARIAKRRYSRNQKK